jgi:alkylated DNA repair dioxygenase AlkB
MSTLFGFLYTDFLGASERHSLRRGLINGFRRGPKPGKVGPGERVGPDQISRVTLPLILDTPPGAPKGLLLAAEAVSPEFEAAILGELWNYPEEKVGSARWVQQFGRKYIFETKRLCPVFREQLSTRLGPCVTHFADRLRAADVGALELDSLLVNRYGQGGGIRAHADAPVWKGRIWVLSLSSDTWVTWTKGSEEIFRLFVPRRSLYSFEGEARHLWQHRIDSADCQDPRTSLTFRSS